MTLTVITGPPCSGKSTYLRDHAKPGDIAVDFDRLAQALGSTQPHEHPAPVRFVTMAARTAAVTSAIKQHLRGHTVWIVDGTPKPDRVAEYQRVGATFVRLSADPAELHRRAGKERPKLWHKLIDDWADTTPDDGDATEPAAPAAAPALRCW